MSTDEQQGPRFHRVVADIEPEVAQQMRVFCAENNVKLKRFVCDAITDYVKRNSKPKRGGK